MNQVYVKMVDMYIEGHVDIVKRGENAPIRKI